MEVEHQKRQTLEQEVLEHDQLSQKDPAFTESRLRRAERLAKDEMQKTKSLHSQVIDLNEQINYLQEQLKKSQNREVGLKILNDMLKREHATDKPDVLVSPPIPEPPTSAKLFFQVECTEQNIHYLGHYYPTSDYSHDEYSRAILQLKNSDSSVIEYFLNVLNVIIPTGMSIAVVPSSNHERIESGIRDLARHIAKFNRRHDLTDSLIRKYSVEKASQSSGMAARSETIHRTNIKSC